MKILMLNQNWFAQELREAGHEVLTIGYRQMNPSMDVSYDELLLPWHEIVPGDFKPDQVIVHDNSAPIFVTDLETLNCPKVFYAVDTHLHTELHLQLAAVFELTMIAQKDFQEGFIERSLPQPRWLPPWAGVNVNVLPEKTLEASFVGTLDAQTNPERVRFFEELQKKIPITVKSGSYVDIYSHSEIVVNHAIRGDLNFRVFEAMMCGAALVTEDIQNGLRDLFRPDHHLILYGRNQVDEAAEKVRSLLSDRKRCREIARNGREEILSAHTAAHRGRQVVEWIEGLKNIIDAKRYFPWMYNYQLFASQTERDYPFQIKKALELSLQMLEKGLQSGEAMSDAQAFFAVRTALSYDQAWASYRGRKALSALAESHPEIIILKTSLIHLLVQTGRLAEAEHLARSLCPDREPAKTYEVAEHAIRTVLTWPEKEHASS